MVGQAARRVEPFHQHLERHILMFEGRQTALPRTWSKRSATVGSPARSSPQHQRIDEEAHQIVEAVIPAVRRSDIRHGHIGTGAHEFDKVPPARPGHTMKLVGIVLAGNLTAPRCCNSAGQFNGHELAPR